MVLSQFGFPFPVLPPNFSTPVRVTAQLISFPFESSWQPVPPVWVTGTLPLKLSGSLAGRAIMLEAKSGMSGSFGSPLADIVIESAPLRVVVLVVIALVNCAPPPAFAVFGKVLLIKGLRAAAPPCVKQVVGSRGEGQADGAPAGCRVR